MFSQLDVLDRICDFSAPRLETLQKLYPGLHFGTSIDEVLGETPPLREIVIATPLAESHYSIASKALLAGKKTYFVEKASDLALRSRGAGTHRDGGSPSDASSW